MTLATLLISCLLNIGLLCVWLYKQNVIDSLKAEIVILKSANDTCRELLDALVKKYQ